MFVFTSMGAKIDHSINRGFGPYVYKISGKIHHRIGALIPEELKVNNQNMLRCIFMIQLIRLPIEQLLCID